MRKILFLAILVSIAGLCLGFFVGKRLYYSYRANTSTDDTQFYDSLNRARMASLAVFPLRRNDIVFVGNSLTEAFPLSEAFSGRPVRNRGIGGNTTSRILIRIGSIARSQPSKIFLECGLNDLRGRVPIDTILVNFQRIVDTIRENCGASIYLNELLPVDSSHAELMPAIQQLNDSLRAFSHRNRLVLLRLYAYFLRGGYLAHQYTTDGIHLSNAGYKVWRDRIDSLVN
jgi:lysophospholipase L1-like esterase